MLFINIAVTNIQLSKISLFAIQLVSIHCFTTQVCNIYLFNTQCKHPGGRGGEQKQESKCNKKPRGAHMSTNSIKQT